MESNFLQECEKSIKQLGDSFWRSQHTGNIFMEIQSNRTKVSYSLRYEPNESKACEFFWEPIWLIRKKDHRKSLLGFWTTVLLHLQELYPTPAISIYFWSWNFPSPPQTCRQLIYL